MYIGGVVALFRCAQKRYEIPRNAFSNLDRFLRSDRQPSEPPTTAAAAAQRDQQQCAYIHIHTHTHIRVLALALTQSDLATTTTQWQRESGKLAAADVGSCCCCGGY